MTELIRDREETGLKQLLSNQNHRWGSFLRDAPSGETEPRPLTPRERQVLRGVFAGKSNKEIAYWLSISEPLAKAVLQQVFAETGVRTRAQLVRTAIERHWKELEEEPDGG